MQKQAKYGEEGMSKLKDWVDQGKPKPAFWQAPKPVRDPEYQAMLPGGRNFMDITRKLKEEQERARAPTTPGWEHPPGGWLCSAGAGQRSLPLVQHATRRLEILR